MQPTPGKETCPGVRSRSMVPEQSAGVLGVVQEDRVPRERTSAAAGHAPDSIVVEDVAAEEEEIDDAEGSVAAVVVEEGIVVAEGVNIVSLGAPGAPKAEEESTAAGPDDGTRNLLVMVAGSTLPFLVAFLFCGAVRRRFERTQNPFVRPSHGSLCQCFGK